MYNPDRRRIGLRPAAAASDHAYPVRSNGNTGHPPYLVSAIAFTKHYRINADRSLRWCGVVEDEVLCVDLDTPGLPVSSNRAGTGSTG